MKKLKKYIVLLLAVITAILIIPFTACKEEVVGVDGFSKEQVTFIKESYSEYLTEKGRPVKSKYVRVQNNLGIYNDNIVVYLSLDTKSGEKGDEAQPDVYSRLITVNDIYLGTMIYKLNCDIIVLDVNGKCWSPQDAYDNNLLNNDNITAIIEIAKTKEFYDLSDAEHFYN